MPSGLINGPPEPPNSKPPLGPLRPLGLTSGPVIRPEGRFSEQAPLLHEEGTWVSCRDLVGVRPAPVDSGNQVQASHRGPRVSQEQAALEHEPRQKVESITRLFKPAKNYGQLSREANWHVSSTQAGIAVDFSSRPSR